jgi:hypothetical protein
LAGGFTAFLFFLPNLLWNIQHHWPFLELMRNIRASGRDVVLSPGEFLWQQILMMTPAILPFWLGGLYFYFSAEGKKFRAFGWAFIFTIGFFLLAHGKNYYSAPVYPLVLAVGAVATGKILLKERFKARLRMQMTLRVAVFAWLFIGIALLLPVVLPVLPIETYIRYQAYLPFGVPKSEHNQDEAILPSITPTSLAGKTWSRVWPMSIIRSRQKNDPGRRFSPVIMAKPAPWIFLAAVMACQKRYVPTRTTFYGDRAITPATSSSALEQNRKMRAIIMKASAWQLLLTIPTPCPTNENRFCFAAIARRIFKPIGPTSRIGTRAIARFPLALAWFTRYFYSPSL